MKVEIRTDDTTWAAEHGEPGRDGRVVVEVPEAERLRFAGVDMLRFRLDPAPCDALNPWTQVPAAWAV